MDNNNKRKLINTSTGNNKCIKLDDIYHDGEYKNIVHGPLLQLISEHPMVQDIINQLYMNKERYHKWEKLIYNSIMRIIIPYIAPDEIVHIFRLNRHWYSICMNDPSLWTKYIKPYIIYSNTTVVSNCSVFKMKHITLDLSRTMCVSDMDNIIKIVKQFTNLQSIQINLYRADVMNQTTGYTFHSVLAAAKTKFINKIQELNDILFENIKIQSLHVRCWSYYIMQDIHVLGLFKYIHTLDLDSNSELQMVNIIELMKIFKTPRLLKSLSISIRVNNENMYNYNDLFNNIKDSLEELTIRVHTDEIYQSEIVAGYINMLSKLKKINFYPSTPTTQRLSLFSLLPVSVEVLTIKNYVLLSKINNNNGANNTYIKQLILVDAPDQESILNLYKQFPNLEILKISNNIYKGSGCLLVLKELLKCNHLTQLFININNSDAEENITYHTLKTRKDIIDFINNNNNNQSTSSIISSSSPLTYGA